MMSCFLQGKTTQIVAVVPFFDQNGGNYSRILLDCGEPQVHPVKATTTVSQIVKEHCLDLEELRSFAQRSSKRKQNAPLAVHPGVNLIPFRYREAAYKDAGANCYVNEVKIDRLEKLDQNMTRIHFKNGTYLDVMVSMQNVGEMRQIAKGIGHQRFQDYLHHLYLHYLQMTPCVISLPSSQVPPQIH